MLDNGAFVEWAWNPVDTRVRSDQVPGPNDCKSEMRSSAGARTKLQSGIPSSDEFGVGAFWRLSFIRQIAIKALKSYVH